MVHVKIIFYMRYKICWMYALNMYLRNSIKIYKMHIKGVL